MLKTEVALVKISSCKGRILCKLIFADKASRIEHWMSIWNAFIISRRSGKTCMRQGRRVRVGEFDHMNKQHQRNAEQCI